METTNITSLVYISTKKTDTQEVNTDFKITLSLPQTLWLGERTGLMITPGLDYQTWGEYIYKAECISWRVSVKKYMNSKGFLLLQLQIQRSYSFCCVLFLVAQSYLTICDPIDCSPPGSSVHGDSSGKNTGVGCHALLQGIFPTQGSNPGLLHCRWILCHLSHRGSPL